MARTRNLTWGAALAPGALLRLFVALGVIEWAYSWGHWVYLWVQVGALAGPSGALTWDPLQCSQAAGHTLSHSALPSAHTGQEQCTTA